MDESEYYVALDIGSSTVKLLVGKVADDTVHVIGVTEVASKGIRKGTIIECLNMMFLCQLIFWKY